MDNDNKKPLDEEQKPSDMDDQENQGSTVPEQPARPDDNHPEKEISEEVSSCDQDMLNEQASIEGYAPEKVQSTEELSDQEQDILNEQDQLDGAETSGASSEDDTLHQGSEIISESSLVADDIPESSISTEQQPEDDDQSDADPGVKQTVSRKAIGITLAVIAGVFVLIFAAFGPSLYRVFFNPIAAFNQQSPQATVALVTPEPDNTLQETPEPVADVYDQLVQDADPTITSGIVNVLIIGVDYADERSTWNKNFYSDVMLVLAFNFDKNTVDMISVPRDTYAKIANKDGIYKLNSSVYHGGGVPDGFPNVCDSVSGVLGGIPINYYVGVTMPVVKELVNAIGGVDFDVDVKIALQGRSLEVGHHHLTGQDVLDYFRARKGIDNDLGRVNRQKKLLLAIFDELKSTKTLLSLPQIIESFQGQAYTNLSYEQMAALCVFGYSKLDLDSIEMYTMPGYFKNIFNWNFILVNQDKRVELIKKIYGKDVPKMYEYSADYAVWLWADITATQYIEKVEKIMKKDRSGSNLISEENYTLLTNQLNAVKAEQSKQGRKSVKASAKDGELLTQLNTTLKETASTIFSEAGYSINWFVEENPGQPRMTG